MGYVPQYNKLVLLRYLRANGFDTSKAMQHIVKNIAWRQEMGVSEIVEQLPEDILGCKMSELTAVFPHWQVGYRTSSIETIIYLPFLLYFDCLWRD